MALVVSFAFGVSMSFLLPVAAFITVVALACVAGFGVSAMRDGAMLAKVLHILVEAGCAQIGYVIGVAGTALFSKMRAREPLPPNDRT